MQLSVPPDWAAWPLKCAVDHAASGGDLIKNYHWPTKLLRTGRDSEEIPRLYSLLVSILFSYRGCEAQCRPRSRSARCAACQPAMPCTPPPGGVEEEHRYSPGTPSE